MKILLGFILTALLASALPAQPDTLHLSLKEAVALARRDAPGVQIAKTAFSNNYWRYQAFLANYNMNADASVAENQLNLQASAERLRNFLGIQRAVYFQLTPPGELPGFEVDAERALQYARAHRSETIAFRRQMLEAERDVAEACGNAGPDVNLNGYFGLSQTGTQIGDAYVQPLDQEQVRLGLNLPIADWGKVRAQMEIARSNQKLAQLTVGQERLNFEREVLIKVQQFGLQRNQVGLALRAYDVAKKRLDMTRKRYRIGKILVTDGLFPYIRNETK